MLKTVKEVVDQLLSELPQDKIDEIRKVMDRDHGPDEDDLDVLHARISFGRYIRNKFGLWQNNIDLAKDCLKVDPATATATFRMWVEEGVNTKDCGLILDEVHPDDASQVINIQLLRKIREIHSNDQI